MTSKFAASLSTLVVNMCLLSFGAEWTLYEQVAVAAMIASVSMLQRTVLESSQSNFLGAPELVSAATEFNFSGNIVAPNLLCFRCY